MYENFDDQGGFFSPNYQMYDQVNFINGNNGFTQGRENVHGNIGNNANNKPIYNQEDYYNRQMMYQSPNEYSNNNYINQQPQNFKNNNTHNNKYSQPRSFQSQEQITFNRLSNNNFTQQNINCRISNDNGLNNKNYINYQQGKAEFQQYPNKTKNYPTHDSFNMKNLRECLNQNMEQECDSSYLNGNYNLGLKNEKGQNYNQMFRNCQTNDFKISNSKDLQNFEQENLNKAYKNMSIMEKKNKDDTKNLLDFLQSLDEDLIDYVRTQKGSRNLQKYLNKITTENLSIILNKMDNKFSDLMVDVYGNYLSQKISCSCNLDQRMYILKAVFYFL
jgi:hypothetical protein